jgi:ABC-type protease/lipase transport system fused ATPase/permease subunit
MVDTTTGITSSLTNGRYTKWFRPIRQIIIFLLGVTVIIYSIVSSGHDVPFLITGLILVGIIPVEDAVEHWSRRYDRRERRREEDS